MVPSQPASGSSICSSLSAVGMSRWLVGSSNTNMLGAVASSPARTSRERSPPERSPTHLSCVVPLNKNAPARFRASCSVMSRPRPSDKVSCKCRQSTSDGSNASWRCRNHAVLSLEPICNRPADAGVSSNKVAIKEVLPVPLGPTMPRRSPRRSSKSSPEINTRSPRWTHSCSVLSTKSPLRGGLGKSRSTTSSSSGFSKPSSSIIRSSREARPLACRAR